MLSLFRRESGIAAAYALVGGIASAAWAGGSAPDPECERVRLEGTTVAFELVDIPAGTVKLDGEAHAVGPLAVGVTEVTWDLYDIFLFRLDEPETNGDEDGVGESDADAVSRPSKPYVPPDRGYGHAGYPAMGMTRHAASKFCEWLSAKTGDTYRLPTRAEWVYLAEANAADEGGVSPAVASDATAWTDANANYTTHPVGKKAPNGWGVHDALGNVAEWVAPAEAAPGERANPDAVPIAMGGSFLDPPTECSSRSAMQQRGFWNASDPQIPKSTWWLADCDFVGFRVVRQPPATDANDAAPGDAANGDE